MYLYPLTLLLVGASVVPILLASCTGTQKAVGPMLVYTDDGTGCQYLAAGDGRVLTPRMGRDGKQVCVEVVR